MVDFLRLMPRPFFPFPTIEVQTDAAIVAVRVRGQRMKRRTRLALSVASGVIAVVLTMWYGSSLKAQAQQERQELLATYGGELVNVCVASRDIEAGETLDESNVRIEEWVAGLLPRDAATSIDDVLGKQATSSIPERAVLCPVYVQARSGALEIPKGSVAVSVAVDAAHAAGGSVETGTEVDVYVSANGIADPLCRAQVIDTSAQKSGNGSNSSDLSWATLAVEPNRVEELLAATARGTVYLVVPGEGVQARDAEASDRKDEEADAVSSEETESAEAAGDAGQAQAGGSEARDESSQDAAESEQDSSQDDEGARGDARGSAAAARGSRRMVGGGMR